MRGLIFCVILLATLSLARGVLLRDRQTFQFQLYGSGIKNGTRAGQESSGNQQQQHNSQMLERRIVFLRNAAAGESAQVVAKTSLGGQPPVKFDAEEEESPEYEEDYKVLEKEFEKRSQREKDGKETERTDNARGHGKSGKGKKCSWIFCTLPTKFVIFAAVGLALTVFLCYSGLICYYMPCGWLSRTKLQKKIRKVLDRNQPGRFFDDEGKLIEYDPCDEEVEMFRDLREELQDL